MTQDGRRRPRGAHEATTLESPLAATWRPRVLERAVLVGVGRGIEESDLDELAALADSAGAEPVARVVQTRQEPNPATFVGKGKIEEVHRALHRTGAEAVILDDELTPGQLRNLEERLKVKVVDRTALILDIFALHARSREGKAQVELAQLNYLLPRLRGWGEAMSRMGGGIGTRRGPGETKLETDRQHIKRRITKLRKDLKDLARTRDVKRSSRERSGAPTDRDRGLYERREVDAPERAHGFRRRRRRPAVRDPGSDGATDPAAERPERDVVGHRRVREQAPARPRRGVPLHARGGRPRHADPARRRCRIARLLPPGGGGPDGARRDRRRPHPRAAGPEQGGSALRARARPRPLAVSRRRRRR